MQLSPVPPQNEEVYREAFRILLELAEQAKSSGHAVAIRRTDDGWEILVGKIPKGKIIGKSKSPGEAAYQAAKRL